MEDCDFNIENFVGESVKEFRSIDVRLARIETVLPTLATKSELTDLKASLIQWMAGFAVVTIGTIIACAAVIVTVLK